ncbi:MAG: 4a-hydroxytetrahydrobiopterin dehydratase [Pseudomonadales bacterium]|nr:4a-hydroxytetrahydrobiopterin dehydratase [Pseudomonadales bacterium]
MEGHCQACNADSPLASDAEKKQWLAQIPDWEIITIEGVEQLQRQYTFKNFVEAMAFAQKITDLAETHNHHPAILIEWGKCQVRWWTHKIHGLHENDFILAANSDVAFS